MVSAPLEQQVGVDAGGHSNGRDGRTGHKALQDQVRLERPFGVSGALIEIHRDVYPQ